MIDLPKPECRLGYTTKQLEEILGNRLKEFDKYMTGQTCAICNGEVYNHNRERYEQSNCGPHGIVTYGYDIKTFLEGRPSLD